MTGGSRCVFGVVGGGSHPWKTPAPYIGGGKGRKTVKAFTSLGASLFGKDPGRFLISEKSSTLRARGAISLTFQGNRGGA